MIRKRAFIILLMCVCLRHTYAQNEATDSLKRLIQKSEPDTGRINLYSALAGRFNSLSYFDSALTYSNKSLALSQKLHYNVGEAYAYLSMSVVYRNTGREPEAIRYSLKALKLFEGMKHHKGMGNVYMQMGIINKNQKHYDEAIRFYNNALTHAQLAGDSIIIASTYNNLGVTYKRLNKFDEALKLFKKSISIYDILGSKRDVGHCYNNIGVINGMMNNSEEAIKNFKIALSYFDETKDKVGQGTVLVNLSDEYYRLKEYKAAEKFALESLKLAKEVNDTEGKKYSYQVLSDIYNAQSRFEAALINYKEYVVIKDSLQNEKNTKKIVEDQMQYEFEKKQHAERLMQEKKQAVIIEEKRKQKVIIVSISVILVLAFFFSLYVYRGLKRQKRTNEIIKSQKHLVEEKQKEILDSITYAQRLQQAILPPHELISKHIPGNFVLYKPKDIVAGDFYWAEKIGDLFFIAAADSTGHGVPGAMVSVVCSNALNRAVKEFGLTDPGKILDKTRELVVETFAKNNTEVKDGMDISLLCIDQVNQKVCWSGANNPLWYVSSSLPGKAGAELVEVKADKQPIGKTDIPKPFTTREIEYKNNTTFYLFTDGLADQFGGPQGKKFKYKQFEQLLVAINDKPMQAQSGIIDEKFEEWKGTLEQVDDVCVIGIKIE